MESRFDLTDDFEHSLKDIVDQFEIAPSAKIWNGLYNHLHPGSRWPSIAMGLVFLFSLLGIGHLNNSTKGPVISDQNSINENTATPLGKVMINESSKEISTSIQVSENKEIEKQKATIIDFVTGKVIPENTQVINELTGKNKPDKIAANSSSKIVAFKNRVLQPRFNSQELVANENTSAIIISDANSEKLSGKLNIEAITFNTNPPTDELARKDLSAIENNPLGRKSSLIENEKVSESLLQEMKANSEAVVEIKTAIALIATGNNPDVLTLENIESNTTTTQVKKATVLKRKRNEKVEWVYFVTPKVSSVYFTGKPLPRNSTANISPIVILPNQVGNNMIYNARLGFEAGTEMQYKFADKWQILTGVQLSYSGYNIISHRVHPTYATLVLKDEAGESYTKGYFTSYGNGQNENQILLPNYNLQASIPVGLQYELWGNKNVQIHVSATLQPSLVMNSHGYLLSSDGRNYIEDQNLMRLFNLGTNFGATVKFKSEKLTWHIGPNVRYQALSSYKDNYPVKEHLIDYGIRIAISK